MREINTKIIFMKNFIFLIVLILFLIGCTSEKKYDNYPSEELVYSFINKYIDNQLKLCDSIRYVFYNKFDLQNEKELLELFDYEKSMKTIFSDYDSIALDNQIINFKKQIHDLKNKDIKIKEELIINAFKRFSITKTNDSVPITVLSYPLISLDSNYMIISGYIISNGKRNGEINIYKRNAKCQLINIADKVLTFN